MTGRQRLLCSLKCEPTDRVSVSPFIFHNYARSYHKDPNADAVEGVCDVYRYFGYDIMHRTANIIPDDGLLDAPGFRTNTKKEQFSNGEYLHTTIGTPHRVLCSKRRFERLSPYHTVTSWVEYLIKTKEDFYVYAENQPKMIPVDLSELRRAKAYTGDDGIVAPWTNGGVFNYAADYISIENLLLFAMTDEPFYDEMMRFFLRRLMEALEAPLQEGIDALSYGGNIANGSIVGPGFFAHHVMAYENELIDYIQSSGTPVLYHNCGDGKNMIETYNVMGFSAFESMTEPPFADMDLSDCIVRFRKDVALIGNIDQIYFLKKASPGEVRGKVAGILQRAGTRKGFILGTSDFIEEDTPLQNLRAITDGVRGHYA